MYGFLFYWSIRVKLVKEVDVYWKVYVDEETGIYDIYRVYMWIGEVSTDNPRPYNPESNTPVM